MANPIQAIRQVYDIEKSARENGCPFDDEDIKRLLERTVSDSNLISQYARFQKDTLRKICLCVFIHCCHGLNLLCH